MKLHVMQSSPASIHFTLLGPHILLNTLFSNTPQIMSLLSVRDQVPHIFRNLRHGHQVQKSIASAWKITNPTQTLWDLTAILFWHCADMTTFTSVVCSKVTSEYILISCVTALLHVLWTDTVTARFMSPRRREPNLNTLWTTFQLLEPTWLVSWLEAWPQIQCALLQCNK
jgi:hypothetical protein